MKFLVCISKVPDTTTRISFTNNNTQFNTTNVQYIVNPYDEWYALVRAIEFKEVATATPRSAGGTVTVINVGPADTEAIIRKALAIGADDAVRIDAEPTDAYFVAAQIAAYVQNKAYDIIFTGKETIDYNGSEVGGMIAELTGLPYVSLASKIDLDGNTATVEREIEGGKEILTVNTPCVISAQKGMAEARIPNMRGIMAARTKPLQVEQPVKADKFTSVKVYQLPKEKGACKLVDPEKPEELIELLHNEAKVI